MMSEHPAGTCRLCLIEESEQLARDRHQLCSHRRNLAPVAGIGRPGEELQSGPHNELPLVPIAGCAARHDLTALFYPFRWDPPEVEVMPPRSIILKVLLSVLRHAC